MVSGSATSLIDFGPHMPRFIRMRVDARPGGSASLTPMAAPDDLRIHSRRSVSEADFPAWWAAHWKAQGYGVVPEHAPDSIPGALAAARARMGAP